MQSSSRSDAPLSSMQEYADALLDAKTLVRILPDAPAGYLKASRCYKRLKSLKAAQTMLDMAVERADDEATIRAVRTEQRKINEDSEQLARERSRPFANELPEEIFLHIASYLSQVDLIRAAQVNQTWRTVLHRHPHLWTTMYLHISEKGKRPTSQHLQRYQIRFYEDRLPEEGQRLLINLSVHIELQPSDTFTLPRTRLRAIYDGQHRFCQNLWRLSVSGKETGEWMHHLHGIWSLGEGAQRLRYLRYVLDDEAIAATPPTTHWLDRFPNLLSYECLSSSDNAAEHGSHWLLEGTRALKVGADGPPAALQRLTRRSAEYIVDYSGEAEPEHNLNDLQHLDIGSRKFGSCFLTKAPLVHLRTLCLNNTLFNANFTLPMHWEPKEATESPHIESFLVPPLDFPCLETMQLVYTDALGHGHISRTRFRLRPSVYLCRLKAPKLRHLTIQNLGTIHPTDPSIHVREHGAWMKFCQAHPQLEEVLLSETTIVDLVESLHYLPNIRKLLLYSVDLPSTFLRSSTSPSLPLLQQLSISCCSSITSGDLMRLVKSKNGNVNYVDIDGCTELEEKAVDWIKNNVKQVKRSGWSDTNE